MIWSFSQAISFQFDAVSSGNDSVEDGIGDNGFVKVLIPLGDRELRADHGGGSFVSVFEGLGQWSGPL